MWHYKIAVQLAPLVSCGALPDHLMDTGIAHRITPWAEIWAQENLERWPFCTGTVGKPIGEVGGW